jgi:cation transport ATPase
MQCPYCTSEISDNALACPHCAHDLYLFKPLLLKIEALEARVAELEKAPQQNAATVQADSLEPVAAPAASSTLAAWAIYWLAPLLILLLAHFTITVAYDLKTVYLRIASLLIPFPFAFHLMRERRHFGSWLAAAFALGAVAAWGMSAVIALVDGTPVLPQDAREWREFIEYAASMGLAYLAGMILGAHMRNRREHAERQASELTVQLAKLITSGSQSAEKLNATIGKLRELSNSLTVAATSAAAAYAGLKGFIDN